MSPRYFFTKFTGGLFLLTVLMMQSLMAQTSGTIRGRVVDAATGDGLPSANVILVNTSIGTSTDLDGNFIIRLVPPGPLTLRASYIGYTSITIEVTMSAGETLEQDFRMSPEVIVGEEVIVSAQAIGQMQAINQQLASNKIASMVSEARIQELPDFNAAQAISRLPGVSTLQSSGEANKVVIRGLAPQYNAVAVGGITLSSTGSTQIGVASQPGSGSSVNTDRSVDLTMITPYMIKSVEVFKSLTPDMNANAIGGYVNMNLREAPEQFRADLLFQSGYTQKTGNYGNYRIVGAASNRFLDGAFGIYILGNAEQYDRDADNMSGSYVTQIDTIKPDGFRPVRVTGVTLNRHVETRNRYGGNLILDYKLPSGTIKSVNVFSRLASESQDFRTILDYQTRNILFRYTEGENTTDAFVNSLEFNNDFGFMSAELKVANSYSRNLRPGSPQFNFQQTGGISQASSPDLTPENLTSTISYKGPTETYLNEISLFSADFKANDQVYKGDFKIPFSLEGISSGYFKVGGEFRYNLRTNDQGTPYAGIRAGSPISQMMIDMIRQRYPFLQYDSTAATFPGANFTSNDSDLNSAFLDNRFGGILWVNDTGVLNGITDFLQNEPSISAVNSSSTNPGGWFDGAFQRLPNKYKYIEKYYAGYLMSELNFGQTVKVVGGVRWEEVKSLFDAFNLSDGRDVNTQVVDSVSAHPYNRYWLPMVQAKWDIFNWVDIRYSYTKTLARPDYHQLSPHFSMDYTQFNVRAGNPRLKPAEAFNHDLFLTFHSNELGLFSIGGFYKEVNNFTFLIQYNLHPTAPPGLDTLGYYAVRSAAGGTINRITPKDGATLTTYINSPHTAYVRGFELDFQTRFWYLPKPFDGTVFGVNFTKIWSKAIYPLTKDTTIFDPGPPRRTIVKTLYSTREGRLINQPNDVLNLYLGYDYEGFSGRLSFLFQGNVVNGIGRYYEQDGFTRDYYRVDISARQKLPWYGLQLFLDVTNLNSRKNEADQASIDGFTSQQYYGMVANLGLRFIL